MTDLNLHIYTGFNPAPCKNRDKVYDRRDKVDRLSYVDSTLMVKRFIAEGKSLQQARAMALRSGQYSGDLKEIAEDKGFAVPVYSMDPALAKPLYDDMVSQLTSSVAEAEAKRREAEAKATEDVSKSSSDSKSESAE